MVYLTVTSPIQYGLKSLRSLRVADRPSTTSKPHHDDAASAEIPPEQSSPSNIDEKPSKSYAEPSQTLEGIFDDEDEDGLKIGSPISHAQVLELSKELKANNIEPYHLDTLLLGSTIWTPPPPPKKEPTSEYKELMARLRRDQEARDYQQMINPTTPAETQSRNLPRSSAANAFTATAAFIEESPEDEATYADINRQVTLIINVLVSIVACSAALWMVSRWWSTPARLALSFGGSILVAVAEVAIYWGYIYKVKESIKTERKIREVKTVTKTWVVGEGEDEVIETDEDLKTPELIKPKEGGELAWRRKK